MIVAHYNNTKVYDCSCFAIRRGRLNPPCGSICDGCLFIRIFAGYEIPVRRYGFTASFG